MQMLPADVALARLQRAPGGQHLGSHIAVRHATVINVAIHLPLIVNQVHSFESSKSPIKGSRVQCHSVVFVCSVHAASGLQSSSSSFLLSNVFSTDATAPSWQLHPSVQATASTTSVQAMASTTSVQAMASTTSARRLQQMMSPMVVF